MIAQDYDTFHKFKPGQHAELLRLPLEERTKKYLELRPRLSPEFNMRLRRQLFEMVSTAVGLDTEVSQKYQEAIKVLRDNTAQSSWENHVSWYLRLEVGSNEYMQALADGFKSIDSDGKMRIMEKPKPQSVQQSPIPEDVSEKKGVQA